LRPRRYPIGIRVERARERCVVPDPNATAAYPPRRRDADNSAETSPSPATSSAWMRRWLEAAAIYNVLWGAWVVLLPGSYFTWLGMEQPRYPELWQCVGMIVGVYGIGYWAASRDPLRHWPIVLVGFLGKIFGPLGFLQAIVKGSLPLAFGTILLTNDVVWWIPFGWILWRAARTKGRRPDPTL
jgi:small multidrug resistance pump